MKSRILVICTVLITCSLLYAKPVTVEQVKQAANTCLKAEEKRQLARTEVLNKGLSVQTVKPTMPAGYTLGETKEILSDDGTILAYVIELEPEGFIITSADTNIDPILGYSFEGKFPFEESKQNVLLHLVKWDVDARSKVMNSKSEEIETLVQSNNTLWDSYSSSATSLVDTLASTTQWPDPDLYGYEGWITTEWDQVSPYNKFCPLSPVNNRRCYVGCVATAASQIINYWKYPGTVSFKKRSSIIGGDGYVSNAREKDIMTGEWYYAIFSIDDDYSDLDFPSFDELNSKMTIMNYDNSEDEIAYLCFAAGIKFGTNYTYSEGSGAALTPSAYTNGFDYGSARGKNFLWSIYKDTVIENIKKGWPVNIGIGKGLFSNGHSVILDGYKSTGEFHVNLGWGGTANFWYDLPIIDTTKVPDPPGAGSYYFDTIKTIVYDICPYLGWNQWGGNQYNNFQTVYTIPDQETIREKWKVNVSPPCKGMVVGTENNVYITKDPLIINDPAYHPALVIFNYYGEKIGEEIEITQTSSTISPPVQFTDGKIYFGAGDGIYRVNPADRSVTKIYSDPGNDSYGDYTPRLDENGIMFFGTSTTLISIYSNGNKIWTWNCPSGGIMYTATPSVDMVRNNIYIGYWKSATQTAYLVCINRLNGATRYEQSFSSIPSADRGIYTPAVGSDGNVYTSVRTKIYALRPGDSSFSQKWVQDKLYARYQPIALGPDNTVYTEYWTQSGGNYYVTLAALKPADGTVKWEIKKPDVGTYTSFGQPYCGSNGVVVFPVKWDTTPNPTFELFAYKDNGSSYTESWHYSIPDDPGATIALGPGAAVYLYGNKKITALSNGDVGDPDGGGMSYTDNVRPNLPSTPTPADEANDINLAVKISWTCSDPEAQSIKYSVFVGESGYDMVPVATGLANPNYDLNGLSYDKGYAWKIIATDGQAVTEGPTWVFATKPPPKPSKATSPTPANGVTGVSVTTDLSWTAGSGATSHDVYFGTANPPPSQGNQPGTTFDTGTMVNNTTYYWRIDEKNAGGTTTGDVWSFKTALVSPGKATNPSPSNGASSVSITTDLSWTAGSGATSHDVYFGTVNPPPSRDNQSGTTFDTGTMTNNTTYYWRIDEKNAGGTTTGDVWSFTTIVGAPGKASNPTPANSATDVSITQDLSWTAGTGATSHDVYFGTVNPPPSRGNQSGTIFDTGTMGNNTTYYWRIDEKNAGGTTTGDIWSFKTIASPTGNFRVWLEPAEAVSTGAQWNIDGGEWQNSGVMVTGLSVGTHTVCYKSITGWNEPECEQVGILNGETTWIDRNYTRQNISLQVKKCTVTAGKGNNDNNDSIVLSGNIDVTPAEFIAAIWVTIDINGLYNEKILAYNQYDDESNKYKYTYKIPKGEKGRTTSFVVDTKKHTFSLKIQKVDLTCLHCPFDVKIDIGKCHSVCTLDENIVNGKKFIPIQLMSGCEDYLQVQSVKIKKGKLTDTLTVKGGIAYGIMPTSMSDVVLILEGQTFTIPAVNFKPSGKSGLKYVCKNAKISEGGIANGTFDFGKCTFSISIKNTKINSASGAVDLTLTIGSFNEQVNFDLDTGQTIY
ncbi:MAG: C10 family peptidase [Sedimentisphaerales bacterium]